MNMRPDHDSIDNLADDVLSRRIDRRTFFQRAAALGLTLSGASTLLAACGGDEQATKGQAGQKGGTLDLRMLIDIQNLDPAFFPGVIADALVFVNVMEGLISYKPGTTEVVNVLAEEFESSPDGLVHTFKLKEGIPFHAGYGEVTAEDVKFSYERIAGLTKPKLESPYAGDWATLDEVKVTGTYTGEIRLSDPFAPLLTSTLPIYSGLVISKAAVEDRGKKFATNPVGSGPYEFVEWVPKQRVVLKKFADYGGASSEFAEPPEWDTIRFFGIEEDSAAQIALETGELDFGEVGAQDVDRFDENDSFATEIVPTLDYAWIGMNVTNPKLEDINVRKAIRSAIDVPSLIEVGHEGKWERAKAIIAPGMPIGFWEDAPVYDLDVDQAKSFLEDAGVSSLELTYTYSTAQPGGKEIAQVVQANLAEIGITVAIKPTDSAVLNELGDVITNLELYHSSFSNSPDPSWATVWFTCEQVTQWNWNSWCNEEYDALHVAALKESDAEKRHEMYIEMQRLWDEAAHTQWLAYRTKFFAFRDGLEPSIQPYGVYTAWDFRAA